MAKTLSEIDWEIEQLSLAIDYYEQGLHHAVLRSQANKYKKIINDLNEKIQDLERNRNEYQEC
jgi:uncharacterized protein (DUF2164 family)